MPTAASKTSTARSRFLTALVAADDPGTASGFTAVLDRWLGGDVACIAVGAIETSVRVPGGTGALVIVPGDPDTFDATILGVLATVRAIDPGLPVLFVADQLPAQLVASALRHGAADALFFDAGETEVMTRIGPLVDRRRTRASGSLFLNQPGAPRMLGAAPVMREMARLVERVATSDATVLILGESGTGKELVAQALHALSPRKKGPFIAINCAAIPETLLENELFGHEKGAYTGASSTAIGKVEAAEKGTLFLDEIGEMPLPLQSKILRLLQERTYDRIGGTKTRKADVRIIAATNRNLKEEAQKKRFREDLYYRLSVVPVPLPPLRERPEDVPLIANAILDKLARDLNRPGLCFAPEAMQRLREYRWPGNVRELENELERAIVLASRDEIRPEDLELRSRVDDPDRVALARLAPIDGPLDGTLVAVARTATRIRVAMAIEETRGDHAAAAERLGMSVDDLERALG